MHYKHTIKFPSSSQPSGPTALSGGPTTRWLTSGLGENGLAHDLVPYRHMALDYMAHKFEIQ
jgi:hypothetical protein